MPRGPLAERLAVLADASLRRLLRKVEEGRPHAQRVKLEEVAPPKTNIPELRTATGDSNTGGATGSCG